MQDFSLLRDIVIIAAAAILVVAVLQRLGLPPIAGLIVAGTLIGPYGLALVDDSKEVKELAEVGVVLLLFGIGLELSLQRVRALWRQVLIGGALQMTLTVGAVSGAALAFGLPGGTALFLGFLTAVSSTAIVLRVLQERGELEAPHGRLTLGVLVFQDLCVVPMVVLIPVLAGQAGTGWEVALLLGKAALVLAGVLVAAHLVVPRALHLVAATRQRNLFVLAVFLICMGTAWIVAEAGISLALGAFLAGLVVSGSEYRTQALADMIPIREVLTSVFFVSIGMLLQPLILLERGLPILGLLLAIVLGKFLMMFMAAAALRLPLRVAVLSAAALAQVGEFGFVLSRAAEGSGLLQGTLEGDLTAATILSMILTPLILLLSPHMAAGAGRLTALNRIMGVVAAVETEIEPHTLRDHAIIAGLGMTGQELARSLRECGVRYVLVDLNPESVRQAILRGEPAYFGDIGNQEVLEHLGIRDARELVIAVNDPASVVGAIRLARRLAPDLHILARTRYLGDIPVLKNAGVTTAIPAELEAAVALANYVMARHGAEEETRKQRTREMRIEHGEIEPGALPGRNPVED